MIGRQLGAAFAAGRTNLRKRGLKLRRQETAWAGLTDIEVVNDRGHVTAISERDCYAASQYGDEAGCLYYYLWRLLRPSQDMRDNLRAS